MKGDTRKYLSRAFDRKVREQRQLASREANAFLKREQLVLLEWKLVTDTILAPMVRIEISGIEK